MNVSRHLQRGVADVYAVNIVEHIKKKEEGSEATRDAPRRAASDRFQALLVDSGAHQLSRGFRSKGNRPPAVHSTRGRRSLQRGPLASDYPKFLRTLRRW